jgi:RNA polymerase sigma factor (sigma-70 family)
MTEPLSSIQAPSDAELISAVRGGDVAAYGELFERHVGAARRLARQLARGPDADDLVSDAFAKVLTVLQSGGGPDVAFRAYLLTAVRRLHVDRVRAQSKLTPADDMSAFDPGVPFRDTAVEGFESAAAAKAFASLPERWQMVLWHLEVEGQKPADIAPLLGMSANSVSALAYRAREGLRQAFLTAHLSDTGDEECRWVTGQLGAYVRGGLSKRDSAKVKAHLDGCRRCTAVYLELTEVNDNLAGIIAPLLLGGAAAAYVSASGGAALGGVGVLVDRAKDFVSGNLAAVGAGAVAATIAVAVAIAIVIGGGGPTLDTAEDRPPGAEGNERGDGEPGSGGASGQDGSGQGGQGGSGSTGGPGGAGPGEGGAAPGTGSGLPGPGAPPPGGDTGSTTPPAGDGTGGTGGDGGTGGNGGNGGDGGNGGNGGNGGDGGNGGNGGNGGDGGDRPSADISIGSAGVSNDALTLALAGLPDRRVVVDVAMRSRTGATRFATGAGDCTVTAARPRQAACVAPAASSRIAAQGAAALGPARVTALPALAPAAAPAATAAAVAPRRQLTAVIPLDVPDRLAGDRVTVTVGLRGYDDPATGDNTITFSYRRTPTADVRLALTPRGRSSVEFTVTRLPLPRIDVRLDLALPEGVQLARAPGGCRQMTATRLRCDDVAAGRLTRTLRFDLEPRTPRVPVRVTATALDANDPDLANNTRTASIGPAAPVGADLALELDSEDDETNDGATVTARVTGVPAGGASLTFALDGAAILDDVPASCAVSDDDSFTCDAGPGRFTAVFTVDYDPEAAPVDLTVSVSSADVVDGNPANDTQTVRLGTALPPRADLALDLERAGDAAVIATVAGIPAGGAELVFDVDVVSGSAELDDVPDGCRRAGDQVTCSADAGTFRGTFGFQPGYGVSRVRFEVGSGDVRDSNPSNNSDTVDIGAQRKLTLRLSIEPGGVGWFRVSLEGLPDAGASFTMQVRFADRNVVLEGSSPEGCDREGYSQTFRCTATGSTYTGVLDAFLGAVPGIPVVTTVTVEAPQSPPVSADLELLWDLSASLAADAAKDTGRTDPTGRESAAARVG